MNTPNYYSILTADVRYDKNLSDFAKILYSEITSLTNKNGYCSASNGYFSELYGKTPNTISKVINDLKRGGYIYIESETSEKGTLRRIYLKGTREAEPSKPVTKNRDGGVTKNREGGSRKIVRGGNEKSLPNNTSNNNTSKINCDKSQSGSQEVVDTYYKLHEKKYGEKPLINGSVVKAIKNILKNVKEPDVLEKLERYYANEYWFTRDGRDIFSFVRHYSAIVDVKPGNNSTKTESQYSENYYS